MTNFVADVSNDLMCNPVPEKNEQVTPHNPLRQPVVPPLNADKQNDPKLSTERRCHDDTSAGSSKLPRGEYADDAAMVRRRRIKKQGDKNQLKAEAAARKRRSRQQLSNSATKRARDRDTQSRYLLRQN